MPAPVSDRRGPPPGAGAARLAALHRSAILDTEAEDDFDAIARLAASICGAPIALVSFVDRDRQWFKAAIGLAIRETPLDLSFCAHAIRQADPMFVVPDASLDPRFASNPLVTGAPGLRFYAGAALETREGHRLGTLCVLDSVPRQLEAGHGTALAVLARQVMALLELRQARRELGRADALLESADASLESADASRDHKDLELRASQESLIRAQRIAHLGNWQLDLATSRLRWSEEVHRIVGIGPEQFGGSFDELFAVVHPDDKERMAAAQARALSGEASLDLEHRIVRPDGTVRWVHELGELERDLQGHPVRLTGTLLDVTDRNRTERLLASEARVLESISSGAPLARVFEQVIAGLEAILAGGVGSILVVDPGSSSLRFVVAPNIAAPFRELTDQLQESVPWSIASSTKEAVVATDIQTDPRWEAHRALAMACGYTGCWSAPILDPTGAAVATVTVYFPEARAPGPRDRDLMSRVAHVVGIAIERDRKEVALRASEDQVRRTFLLAPIGIVITTADGRFVDANAAYCALVGYSLAELQERDLWSLIHPDDRHQNDLWIRDVLDGHRGSFVLEKRYLHKAGQVVWVRASVSALPDAHGGPSRIIAVAEDITERKQAETALADSEHRFRLLSQVASDAVWDWEIAGDRLTWNEGFETLFGYRRDQVDPSLGSWREHVHPEDRGRVLAGFHAALASGKNQWSAEYRFIHRSGAPIYVLDRAHVMRDPSGTPIWVIGGMTDLTERRRVEETLREQATLLDQAQDAILVRDLDHRVLYWNRSAERVYGWTAAEAQGRSTWELLYRDPEAFSRATEAVLAHDEWSGELEQVTKAGKTITVEGKWTLVRDERGAPRSILSIHTDITQRRSLEVQFLRSQRLESIGTLAGGIAHDLNNVLAPILIASTTLLEVEEDPERLEDLSMIETCAQRGADMVRQLMSFARGGDGRRVRIPLGPIAQQVRQMIKDTFPKNIAIQLNVAPDLWQVDADSTQLHQVLTNLCVNARDAMPLGGILTITLENTWIDQVYAHMRMEAEAGPYALLTVEDTGTGMPPDVADRIFEPFFTTKELGKGTGLGLSTAHAIIRNHGGFVRVSSEVGRGTRLQVHLPAAPLAEKAETAPSPTPQQVLLETIKTSLERTP